MKKIHWPVTSLPARGSWRRYHNDDLWSELIIWLSPVNIYISHARYVFWNAGGLGWSIGKRAYLESGSYWHKSGADSDEPWQVDWERGVTVRCHQDNGRDTSLYCTVLCAVRSKGDPDHH